MCGTEIRTKGKCLACGEVFEPPVNLETSTGGRLLEPFSRLTLASTVILVGLALPGGVRSTGFVYTIALLSAFAVVFRVAVMFLPRRP
jgi:hypothetical protein